MLYTAITACRSCGSERLTTVLDLGMLAISDFVLPGEQVNRAPLELAYCENCTLLQLRHTVDRKAIYRDYWYRSGTNESMVAALKDVVDDVSRYVRLEPGDAVIDIGSNDSTMLKMYPSHVRRIGIEPSNVGYKGTGEGLEIVKDYFPIGNFPILPKAKVVCSVAQMYNVHELNAYMAAVKQVLHPDGVFCVQMAYLPATLDTLNVGDFVHEHLTFWTVESLYRLLRRHGLGVVNIIMNTVNGGSFRVIARHGEGDPCWQSDAIAKGALTAFAGRVERLKNETVALLQECKRQGALVLGLGASTKGNGVLDYYGIGPKLIPAFAERQSEKHGRCTVTGIPIVSEEVARAMQPDYFFVGPFHFLDVLKEREHAFLEGGGKFIVPFPELRVVGLEAQPTGYSFLAVPLVR